MAFSWLSGGDDVAELIAKRNYSRAAKVLRGQLAKDPSNASIRQQLADVLALDGKTYEAVELLWKLADEYATLRLRRQGDRGPEEGPAARPVAHEGRGEARAPREAEGRRVVPPLHDPRRRDAPPHRARDRADARGAPRLRAASGSTDREPTALRRRLRGRGGGPAGDRRRDGAPEPPPHRRGSGAGNGREPPLQRLLERGARRGHQGARAPQLRGGRRHRRRGSARRLASSS